MVSTNVQKYHKTVLTRNTIINHYSRVICAISREDFYPRNKRTIV